MRASVTKRLVDGLKAAAADFYVFDPVTIGFGLRVRATGGMSYIVQYKAPWRSVGAYAGALVK